MRRHAAVLSTAADRRSGWHWGLFLRRLLIAAALVANLGGCGRQDDAAISETMNAHEPSLAVGPDATFAAWHGGVEDRSLIYLRELDARLQPADEIIVVSDGKRLAYEPDVIVAAGLPVVAWYEKDPVTRGLTAWLAGMTRQGERAWLTPLAAGGDEARNPVVRQIGDRLEVAWIEQPSTDDGSNSATIWWQRFSLAGATLDPPQRIGEATRDTWNLNATVADDRLVVTYDAALGTRTHELHMLTVGDGESAHRQLSDDDGHASLYPDLQIGASVQAALTWFDERDGNREVYMAVGTFGGLAEAGVLSALRVSHTDGDSIGAYLAWNGTAIGLVWSDDVSGERDIFAQTFDAGGKPLDAIGRLGASPETAGVPVIRAQGTGFVVAWNDYVANGGGAHTRIASSEIKLARLPLAD